METPFWRQNLSSWPAWPAWPAWWTRLSRSVPCKSSKHYHFTSGLAGACVGGWQRINTSVRDQPWKFHHQRSPSPIGTASELAPPSLGDYHVGYRLVQHCHRVASPATFCTTIPASYNPICTSAQPFLFSTTNPAPTLSAPSLRRSGSRRPAI